MGATGSDRVLLGVAPTRLAVPSAPARLPRSVSDEAHKRVVRAALDWQQQSDRAIFWELGAVGGVDEGRIYALAGQMASAGEQLALAFAAAVEVALWRELRENEAFDEAHEMCMRAMAEAQCLFVIGTGHALANVLVRALALDPELRAKLVTAFTSGSSVPTFEPFSQHQRDWVSLSVKTCQKIQTVVRCRGDEAVIRLVEPVVAIGAGKSWRQLLGRRGEDFHRWRPQSHGTSGIPRMSPWTRDGETRSLPLERRVDDQVEALAEGTAQLASEAMLELSEAMQAFMERWSLARPYLGGRNRDAE